MKYNFAKDLKTGDFIGVAYSNKIHPAFYVESIKGNYYWEWWAIKNAYEKFKNGEKTTFKPHVSYLNSNSKNRIVKLNFYELEKEFSFYQNLELAVNILRELKIIKY